MLSSTGSSLDPELQVPPEEATPLPYLGIFLLCLPVKIELWVWGRPMAETIPEQTGATSHSLPPDPMWLLKGSHFLLGPSDPCQFP